MQPLGLGKGLDALIRETQDGRDAAGATSLPLDDILPNPAQPRRDFSEKALEELALSIRSQGILQPLLVRPLGPSAPGKYEIVAGERRWRASRLAGLSEVPVLVRSFSAKDTLAAALIENLQREDLNPVDEALGLQTLKEEFSLSQDDLAQAIGKSRSAVANSLRLLGLPESMRPLLAEGKLSPGHARALLSVTDPKAQEYLKNVILESRISVRETEGLAAGWKSSGRFELAMLNLDAEPEAQSDTARKPKSPEDAPAASGTAKAKKPQSAVLLDIQNRMALLYQTPVRVTGRESKGKISFSYKSKEELESLLQRLNSAQGIDGQDAGPPEAAPPRSESRDAASIESGAPRTGGQLADLGEADAPRSESRDAGPVESGAPRIEEMNATGGGDSV